LSRYRPLDTASLRCSIHRCGMPSTSGAACQTIAVNLHYVRMSESQGALHPGAVSVS
jgi:hypothetical protein